MAVPLLNTSARWVVGNRLPVEEERLQRELKIPSIVAAVLAQRGYTDPAEAYAFLNPSLDQLNDPRRLPDYEKAVKQILGARERKELIYVHGDYDVDGITSAAILSRFLKAIGCQVHAHVPHRMKEGYGIHESAVEAAKMLGAKLFLTCDCGIGAHEQVEQAIATGMAVVVTDHHTVGPTLPNAHAVINPHRSDSDYPFPELSGAGVAFKLCEGITSELKLSTEKFYRAFLDLAALGTIADVMPLVGENRVIARFGLERLGESKKVGLQALMHEANVGPETGKPLRAYHVGFVLGPRLNAAGRIDDAGIALQLLLETDPVQATALAKLIEGVNLTRRTEQQRIIEEAVQMVLDQGLHERNVIMVGHENWHSGIVGIVAGRLVEQFRRPCFVLTIDTQSGICKGSARTIPKFNLASAIRAQGDLFISGGGHAMAAGCTFELGNLNAVSDALNAYAGQVLTQEDFVPVVSIDLEVMPEEVTIAATEALANLEPFGCDNPEPVLMARSMALSQILPTRNPCHARLLMTSASSAPVNGIAFGIGERLTQSGAGTQADVIFQPSLDEWRGQRQLKWQVKDYRTAIPE